MCRSKFELPDAENLTKVAAPQSEACPTWPTLCEKSRETLNVGPASSNIVALTRPHVPASTVVFKWKEHLRRALQ